MIIVDINQIMISNLMVTIHRDNARNERRLDKTYDIK